MEAGFRNADLCNDLLKMLQDRVADQMTAFRIDEDEVVLAFPWIESGKRRNSLIRM